MLQVSFNYMNMDNTLIDNTENLKLVDTLKEIISNPECNHLQIATGYWDLPGIALLEDQLRAFFERGGRLDLLIGKEPQLRSYQLRDDLPKDEKFPDFYIKRDVDKLNDTYRPIVELILKYADIDNETDSQIKIHVYGQKGNVEQFLHAKCYIAYSEDSVGIVKRAFGIVGSSNFTEKGLQDNAELNYLETNKLVVASPSSVGYTKSHYLWFKEKWEQSEPWTGKFINDILLPSPIGKKIEDNKAIINPNILEPLTPYEVYIKYLQMQFGDMVDANTTEVLKSYLPASFNPLEYQMDAVKHCFSVMKRFGGFLLGDVVGLGKTIVGILLIRHFLEHAETLGRAPKVLIITPPSIKSTWVKTIATFDENTQNNIGLSVEYVTTGSISKLLDAEDVDDDTDEIDEIKADNYGLIIIDESHNFRNSSTQKYNAVNDLIGSINPTPYIALLSATPQNNSPKDIYNQIRFFQRDANKSNLPGVESGKLDSFFTKQENRFKEARSIPQDTDEQRAQAKQIIAEVSDNVRKCVLNDILVRRTRTDIRKMYGEDAELLKFPTVQGPHKLEYHMDEELAKLFADTTEAICPPPSDVEIDPNIHIGFYRYAAITQFRNPEHTRLYEKRNLTVESITRRLKRIMQILLVKRLESSMAAFKTTLENLCRYNNVMIDMLQHDCVFICPDIEVNKLHLESKGDFTKFLNTVETLIKIKGGNNRRFSASDFNESYLDDLLNDKKLIESLLDRWRANTYDPKFDRFKEAIKPELFAPDINNPSGKNKPRLVIFTEAIDTLDSIARALKAKGYKVLTISAKNRSEKQADIEANFDANLSPDKQRDDYDVIVTTEVLAEGINLHRANVILNYDAPWNATRLMQRIGRVNRIGSTEEFVHVFNFFPSDEGNAQIRLIEKAYAKLQSFHEMFGEDNKVFSEREELSEHDLQRFTEGEESPFVPFIKELKDYRDTNPDRYAYIASVAADNLGGRISIAHNENSIFVFTDNSGSYISVEVPMGEIDEKPRVVSSLVTMEKLKCDPDAEFCDAELGDAKLTEIALRTYHNHVVHYNTASDSRGDIKKAQGIIANLRAKYELTIESRKLLKKVEDAVKAKNSTVIKEVLKLNQPGLFGLEFDLDSILQASFSSIAERAQLKRGEARTALYEII